MSEIIPHPEYEKLVSEIEELQRRLLALLAERDELKFHICKNIETVYMLKLGSLEYKAFEWMCKMLRLKRKIELIRAKFNRQQLVNLIEIDGQLDAEFSEYTDELNAKMDSVNSAIEMSRLPALSDSETEELKKLYRDAVKKLHPDLNPDIGEEQLRLYYNAVEAYKDGDLAAMRTIALILDGLEVDSSSISDGLDELNEKKEKIISNQKQIVDEMQQIKSSFPYCEKNMLENDGLLKERQDEIKSIISSYQETCLSLESTLENLLGGEGNG